MGRYGEIWGDMGRRGETWGDVGRYGQIWGDVTLPQDDTSATAYTTAAPAVGVVLHLIIQVGTPMRVDTMMPRLCRLYVRCRLQPPGIGEDMGANLTVWCKALEAVIKSAEGSEDPTNQTPPFEGKYVSRM